MEDSKEYLEYMMPTIAQLLTNPTVVHSLREFKSEEAPNGYEVDWDAVESIARIMGFKSPIRPRE